MSGTTLETPKPRRRRLVLSLRALMVAVLIVGGVLGWRARRASIQRRAVAAIREAGGKVSYNCQIGDGTVVPGAPSWWPAWSRSSIGDEYFAEVATVFLADSNGSRPTEETLEAVARLDQVESLQEILRSRSIPAAITARGLDHIARLPRLRSLELCRADLTDPSSLAPLAKLTRLEYLGLWKSPADDTCLAHLRELTGLKTLDLPNTKVTDAGLDNLEGMRRLETLIIDGSLLTDAGAARLAGHSELRELRLNRAMKLTDASLASLSRLRSITELHLSGSTVTDAGLGPIGGLKLDSLGVSGPGVTDAGLAALLSSNQFRQLDLSGTGITGGGLALLSGQAKLLYVSLDRSKVDDAGVAALATIPALKFLNLSETAITDAGLVALQQVPSLQYFVVHGTQVTDKGLAALKKARPGLMIMSGPVPVQPDGP